MTTWVLGVSTSSRRCRIPERRSGGGRRRRNGPVARTAIALAVAAGALALLAGCSLSRPVAAAGQHACNLPKRVVTIDFDGTGAGPARAQPHPLTQILDNAVDARAARTGPSDAGDAPPVAHLVLSGGGQHGSFGTGFLAEMDPVPQYGIVTGVSTGALGAYPHLAQRAGPLVHTDMIRNGDVTFADGTTRSILGTRIGMWCARNEG